jgi:hypothetical protein
MSYDKVALGCEAVCEAAMEVEELKRGVLEERCV